MNGEMMTKQELMAVRLLRGYNRFQMARLLGFTEGMVSAIERGRREVSLLTQQRYIDALKIKPSEINRIRKALSGEKLELYRDIPDFVKDEVRKRENNRCSICDYSGKLHFHHKKKFSEGGLHTADNLLLLCPDCHAEAHVGEVCYAMLKSKSKKKIAL